MHMSTSHTSSSIRSMMAVSRQMSGLPVALAWQAAAAGVGGEMSQLSQLQEVFLLLFYMLILSTKIVKIMKNSTYGRR